MKLLIQYLITRGSGPQFPKGFYYYLNKNIFMLPVSKMAMAILSYFAKELQMQLYYKDSGRSKQAGRVA